MLSFLFTLNKSILFKACAQIVVFYIVTLLSYSKQAKWFILLFKPHLHMELGNRATFKIKKYVKKEAEDMSLDTTLVC